MNNFTGLFKLQPAFQQFFRGKRIRKPISLGTAKSKLFRIPKRPVIPIEERNELFRLHTTYKTAIRSIRSFLTIEYEKNQEKVDIHAVQKEAAIDFERCKKKNEEWNKAIAETREKRLQVEREANIEEAMKRIEAKKIRDQKLTEKMQLVIEKEKEYMKNLITAENIDQAIEQALSNITSYNHAIDSQGNIVTDSKPKSSEDSSKTPDEIKLTNIVNEKSTSTVDIKT